MRPSWSAGSDRETLPKDGSGNEAILGGQKCSAGPPRRLRVVMRPSQRSAGSDREALPEGREW